MGFDDEFLKMSRETIFSYGLLKNCFELCNENMDLLKHGIKVAMANPGFSLPDACLALISVINGGVGNGFAQA